MPFGIQNIGATCYMNSVLQAIHSSPLLKTKLEGDDEFVQLVKTMNVPEILKRLPQFPVGSPHDAHEALLAVIDKLEKSMDKDLFYGTSETTVINGKGEKTTSTGTFGALMLESPTGGTLDQLYENASKMEYVMLEGAGFVCKTTTYTKLPQVLVCVITNSKPIELPETFQGRKLNCIISHMGHRDAGHYIAIVKEGDDTFLIDDDKIFKVDGPFTGPVYVAIYS